ncbi:MAG: lytic transglycosylase domain-containing protein [Clostridia bacterium]|nr:lytic transglycosylase domain-containing protein [Clostridia bacterium]
MKKRNKRNRRCAWPAFLVLVLLGFCVYAFWRIEPDLEHTLYPRAYQSIVQAEAETFGVEESLVYAVIKAESNFDAQAESPVGALGLMQMMPNTFTWMQSHVGGSYPAEALFEPEISIRFGCALLKLLLNEYGDLTVALSAYNAGMGNVTSWLSDTAYSDDGVTLKEIPFPETRIYVKKVLRYKEIYEKIYGGMENG